MKRVFLVVSGVLLASLASGLLMWSTPGCLGATGQPIHSQHARRRRRDEEVRRHDVADGLRPVRPGSANARRRWMAKPCITVACTKGAVVKIGIDDGASGTPGAMRRMDWRRSTFLTYELFQDSAAPCAGATPPPMVRRRHRAVARSATVYPLRTRAGRAGRSGRRLPGHGRRHRQLLKAVMPALSPVARALSRDRARRTRRHDRRDPDHVFDRPVDGRARREHPQRGDDDHQHVREGTAV